MDPRNPAERADFLRAAFLSPTPWILNISNSGHLWVERQKIIDLKFFKGGTFLQMSIQAGTSPLSFPGGRPPNPPHKPPLEEPGPYKNLFGSKTLLETNPVQICCTIFS